MEIAAYANYNRLTRQAWLSSPDGRVFARRDAAKGERMIDAAAHLIRANGLARTGNYMLVASGAPLRRAALVRLPHDAPASVQASAVSRVIGAGESGGRVVVTQYRENMVVIDGHPGVEGVRKLRSLGYQVTPRTANQLVVTPVGHAPLP